MALEWQPMDTAPTDGTPVLLRVKAMPYGRAPCVPDAFDNITLGAYGSDDSYHGCAGWFSVEAEDNGSMGGEMTGWMAHWQCLSIEPIGWSPVPPIPWQKRVKP